jgi:hypothetical protein
VTNTVNTSASFFVENLVRTFVDPERGVLLWSPILVVAVLGIRRGWGVADPLVRSAALAGVLLLLVQLRGNVWNGGDAFFAYRYPLEAVYLVAPLAATAAWEWVRGTRWRNTLAGAAAFLSVIAHAAGSVLY